MGHRVTTTVAPRSAPVSARRTARARRLARDRTRANNSRGARQLETVAARADLRDTGGEVRRPRAPREHHTRRGSDPPVFRPALTQRPQALARPGGSLPLRV